MAPMTTDVPTASTCVEPSSDVMTSSSCCIDDSISTIGALCRESSNQPNSSTNLKNGNYDSDDDDKRLSRQDQDQAEEEEREYYYADVYNKKNYSRRRSSSDIINAAVKESENKKCSPWLEIFLGTLVFLVLLGLLIDLFFSLMLDEMNKLNCTDDNVGIAGDVAAATNVDASQNFQLNDIPIIE